MEKNNIVIEDLKDEGINILATKKGPDSVDYGMKFLQSLEHIYIDRRRCPNTYNEFLKYEYEQNRNGDFISAYPDKNNHAIDSARYALNDIIMKRSFKMFDKSKLGL